MRTTTRAGRTWHFLRAIGLDSVIQGLRYPCSVAVATDGSIFVLSKGMQTTRPLDGRKTMAGCKLGKWSLEGNFIGDFGRKEFLWPTCIAISSDGNIYASDELENFIAVFGPDGPFYDFPLYDPDGEYLSRWGETGPGGGQIDGPSGLAFDAGDNLHVVDSRNDRVQKFTKDGKYLMAWGTSGSNDGQFSQPWGITIDRAGDIYIADWGNHRVQKFAPDGTFLMRFGSLHQDGTELKHPVDVAVDSDGDVYVTDWGNKRVQIYEPDGEIIGALYGDATDPFDSLPEDQGRPDEMSIKAFEMIEERTILGKFDRPMGIVTDDQDRIYVADCRRGRVQIYTKDNGYVAPPADL